MWPFWWRWKTGTGRSAGCRIRTGRCGVTLVFRREGGAWKLMHRQADALTHPISHDTPAALAPG
jgi:hypothetical protein